MVLGFLWYGPLFGKKWMHIVGANDTDAAHRKEMEKGMWKLYLTSFLLALLQAYVLAYYIQSRVYVSGLENALWIWVAFLVPTVAAGSMWNNDSAKVSWSRFLIQAGYYLVLFTLFGLILGYWK